MRQAKKINLSIAFSLLVALITPIASMTSASATVACNPTYVTPVSNGYTRNYLFKDAGTCEWTVPTGMYVKQILLVGGGGGGGGGSWKGTSFGGGGGGGGGGGSRVTKALTYLSAGTVIPVTIGAGGAAGAGASSQTGTGSTGGDGGDSSFATLTVDGGKGGGGGGDDTGGAGGMSGRTDTSGGNYGGAQNSGNGGGGASSAGPGTNGIDAQSGSGGGSRGGSTRNTSIYSFPLNFTFGDGGSGGASKDNLSVSGGDDSQAAQATAANSGRGGHGGHGCAQSESTCLNRNGSAGATGQILVAIDWVINSSDGLSNINTKVGLNVNYRPFYAPEPLGTGTWSAQNLPSGLSINSSTGVVSGSPTVATTYKASLIRFTDSYSPENYVESFMTSIIARGETTYQPSNQSLEYGKSIRIPIENILGTGLTTVTTNSPTSCQLSGPSSETVTATRSTGKCQIYVSNPGDAGYFSYFKTLTITLTKQSHTISLAKSVAGDIEVGTPITLTTTVNSGVTGLVQFYAGDTLIQSCASGTSNVTIANSQASCTWTPTASSSTPYSLKSKYLGSSNYELSTSSPISLTVRPSILLSYSGSDSVFGSTATASPNISGGTGDPSTWSWSIKKTSDNSSVSGITIDSSGVVSVASTVAAATYNMTVTVIDSATITKSAPIKVFVAPTTPTVTFNRPNKTEVTKGQTVTLSATLPSDASGTVTFKYGSTSITSCGTSGLVTISSGSASCNWNTSQVSAGQYAMTAAYSGGGNYTASTSNSLSMQINDKSVFSYADVSTDYKVATSVSPVITANTGTGDPSDWSWDIVKRSDSATVSGITIDSTGLISVSDAVGAGTYVMSASAVDIANDTTTVTVNIVVNKVRPVLTLSPRITGGALSAEGTVNRQLDWRVESTHRSSSLLTLYINGVSTSCSFYSIAWGDGQCWWSPTNGGETITAYVSFPGDSNLETATSNIVTNFKINTALSLSYPNASTYAGFAKDISPVSSGGTTVKRYGITQHFTGAVIPGISVDSATGVVTVARSAIVGNYRMVVSVMDEAGASNYYNDLYLDVLDQVTPSFSLSSTSETVEKNNRVNGFTLIHSATPGTSYAISPALPSGLSFSSTTGEITGAPTAAAAATTYTITASNVSGSATATFSLTVSETLFATISIAVGSNPAAKGTANTIVATISSTGKVQFFIDNKRVPGCASITGTTSVTCNWKPSSSGKVTLKAKLTPSNSSIPVVTSNPLQVSIGRRTGLRG